jgi:hypothetical protein
MTLTGSGQGVTSSRSKPETGLTLTRARVKAQWPSTEIGDPDVADPLVR